MKKSDLISLYMEMEFGCNGSKLLKSLVNDALDNNEWHDGFYLAVKKGNLESDECSELFEIVHKLHPEIPFHVVHLKNLIDKQLPQSSLSKIKWLVGEDGSVIITDSLRVGRFLDNSLLWVTKRISWDGIKLFKIDHNEIIGQWYNVIKSHDEWETLRFSFSNGELLEGEEINF